jgi:hypothetical protein
MAIKEYPSLTVPSVNGQSGKILTNNGSNLSWSAVSGGMTLLTSGTLNGASSISITSIPSTYIDLMLYIENPQVASAGQLCLRINGSTTATYGRWFFQSNGSNGGDGPSNTLWNLNNAANNNLATTGSNVSASVRLFNYTSTTTQKSMSYQVQDRTNTFSSLAGTGGNASNDAVPISSIQIISSGGAFNAGTYLLYGVK